MTKHLATRLGAITLSVAAITATGTAAAPRSYADEAAAPAAPSCLPAERLVDAVVLVTLDGVRWQEIFHGVDPALARDEPRARGEELAPSIHALARAGVALGAPGHGEPFLASGPNFVSLPGYTELLTGAPAPCQENDCRAPPGWTLADGFTARGELAGVFSSWEPVGAIAAADTSRVVVSSGRSAGYNLEALADDARLGPLLARGRDASPTPGHGSYRPDALTAELALAWLSRERPRFFFLSLGDTDEHAHDGDYRSYLQALRDADAVIGEVAAITDGWRAEGQRVVVVVTTDHGRAHGFRDHGRDHPESARGWLVAAGDPIAPRGLVSSPSSRRLRDVAPTLRALAALEGPPPEAGGVALPELLPACAR